MYFLCFIGASSAFESCRRYIINKYIIIIIIIIIVIIIKSNFLKHKMVKMNDKI